MGFTDFSCDIERDKTGKIYFYSDDERPYEVDIEFDVKFKSIDEFPEIQITSVLIENGNRLTNILDLINEDLISQMTDTIIKKIERNHYLLHQFMEDSREPKFDIYD